LGGAIGGSVWRGSEAVLRGNEDDIAADLLAPENAEGFAADEEIARGQYVHILVPEGERGVLNRGGRGQTRVGDENVEPAKFNNGMGKACHDLFFDRDVDVDPTDHVGAEG